MGKRQHSMLFWFQELKGGKATFYNRVSTTCFQTDMLKLQNSVEYNGILLSYSQILSLSMFYKYTNIINIANFTNKYMIRAYELNLTPTQTICKQDTKMTLGQIKNQTSNTRFGMISITVFTLVHMHNIPKLTKQKERTLLLPNNEFWSSSLPQWQAFPHSFHTL